jgi:multisubunit Na+/H+ antiporter MnhG subunit
VSGSETTVSGGDLDVQTRNVLFLTQVAFFASLAWCYLIYHGPVVQIDGISYYGVFHRTLPILFLGYLVAAIGLWRTGDYLRSVHASSTVWIGLRVVGLSLMVLLATPFNHGAWLNWAHMTTGVIGAVVQLAITWRLLTTRRTVRSVAGFVVQLGGGLLSAASLPDWHFSYLFTGEVLYQMGFAWCLIEWTYTLTNAD